MQQHAMHAIPVALAQLLLFCQLLHALVHTGRRPAGRDAEFHSLTSCPAIPYAPYAAAEADVHEATLAIPPKCKYNRGTETK